MTVAPTTGFQPVPVMATSPATTAFVPSPSAALWEETRPHGVHVMALCPGVTETNFFEAAKIQKPPLRGAQTPEDVVETALRGLSRGESHIVSGWTNLLMIESERLVPRSFVARMAGRVLRPYFGDMNKQTQSPNTKE